MVYTIQYDPPEGGDGGPFMPPLAPRPVPLKRRFEMPSLLRTASTIAIVGALFFGAEAFLPIEAKPSSLVGTYDARLQAQVEAATNQQKARYEGWAKQVELVKAQNTDKYRAATQGVLQHYTAGYERAKVFAEATARIQTLYVQARIAQRQVQQSGDQSIISLTRMFGRLFNVLEPGSGDAALSYAEGLSRELQSELDAAAQNGQTISVEGWNTDLPDPAEVQAQLEALKPEPLPPLPELSPVTAGSVER